MSTTHPPIAVMSFNRPDYLRQVLHSLAQQKDAEIERREIFLFQDGWKNAYSGRVRAEEAEVEACIALFREVFPNGHVHASPANIGVAENFLRAETLFFRAMKAECGYFFEDDMVLAPRYLATLDALRDASAASGKVGYFACYGHLPASAEEQRAHPGQLRLIHHLWGFGLFREHWEEMQPLMAEYYDLVLGRDYRDRPTPEIVRRLRAAGTMVSVSSQDDVKKAATYRLGRVGLNTTWVNARYIGATGIHMNPRKFAAAGFDRTVLLDIGSMRFDVPDAASLDALSRAERDRRQALVPAALAPAPKPATAPPPPATAAKPALARGAAEPHPPIAVMSFNRPDYLRQVLHSLAQQKDGEIERREVFLFQDGWRNPHSGRVCAEASQIAACIETFREIFPRGQVMASPGNLGVAENFLRAETLFFREMKVGCGYFFEDDMVLAPRYLATLDALRDAVAPSGRVGYFACYGHLQATAEQQMAHARMLRRIGHLWGFGLFRSHWERMQPAMADYYELVVGRDYKERPHAEILRRYRERGIPIGVTSQDDVKKAVTYSLGAVALNTQVASARYIGEVGLHSNAASFERGGYARTVVLDLERVVFDIPDDAAMEALRTEELERRRLNIEAEAKKAAEKAAEKAAAKAAAKPSQARPAVAPASTAPAPAPMAPPVAAKPAGAAKLGAPRMSPAERALFDQVLASGRRRYAEFGTGGSTLLAVREPFEAIVGVESDPAWAKAVRQDEEVALAVASGRASILHADIGPVGAWGSPVDRTAVKPWPAYIATMWREWDRRGAFPDLVLVDGRFRVACALSVALLWAGRRTTQGPPLVVLHDVSDRRPNYRRVFDFFHLEEQAETLCVFSPRQRVSPEAILTAMLDRIFEVT